MDKETLLNYRTFLIMKIFGDIIIDKLKLKYNTEIFIKFDKAKNHVILIITPNNTNYIINATYKLDSNAILFNLSLNTGKTTNNYEFSSYYQYDKVNKIVNHIYKMPDLQPLFPQLKDLNTPPTPITKDNINLDSLIPVKNPYILLNKLLADNYIRNDTSSADASSIMVINKDSDMAWINMALRLLQSKNIEINEHILDSFKDEASKINTDTELNKYAKQNNRFIERKKRGNPDKIETVQFKIDSKELYETNNWFTNINANRYATFYNDFNLTISSAIIKTHKYNVKEESEVVDENGQKVTKITYVEKKEYTIAQYIDPIKYKLLYPFCITDLFLYIDSRNDTNTMGYQKYNISSVDNIKRAFELIELSKQIMMTIMSLFFYVESELNNSDTNTKTIKININFNKIYSGLSWYYDYNPDNMIFSFKIVMNKTKKNITITENKSDESFINLPLIPLIEVPYIGVSLPISNEQTLKGINKASIRLLNKHKINYKKPASQLLTINLSLLAGLEKLILSDSLTSSYIERLYKEFNYGIELENIEQSLKVDLVIPDMESLEEFPELSAPVEKKSPIVNITQAKTTDELKELSQSLFDDISDLWWSVSQKLVNDLLYDSNISQVNIELDKIADLIDKINFNDNKAINITNINTIIPKICLYLANIKVISNITPTDIYSANDMVKQREIFKQAIIYVLGLFKDISRNINIIVHDIQLSSSNVSANIIGSNEHILLSYIKMLRMINIVINFLLESNNENTNILIDNLKLFKFDTNDESIIEDLKSNKSYGKFVTLISNAEQKRIDAELIRKQAQEKMEAEQKQIELIKIESLKKKQIEAEEAFRKQVLAESSASKSEPLYTNVIVTDNELTFYTKGTPLEKILEKEITKLNEETNNTQMDTQLESIIKMQEQQMAEQQRDFKTKKDELDRSLAEAEKSRKKIELERKEYIEKFKEQDKIYKQNREIIEKSFMLLQQQIFEYTEKKIKLLSELNKISQTDSPISEAQRKIITEQINKDLAYIESEIIKLTTLQEENNNKMDDIQLNISANREIMEKLNKELSVKNTYRGTVNYSGMTVKKRRAFRARVHAIFTKLKSLKNYNELLERIQLQYNELIIARTELSKLTLELNDNQNNYRINKKARIQKSALLLSDIEKKTDFIKKLKGALNTTESSKTIKNSISRQNLDILKSFCSYITQYNEIAQLNIEEQEEAFKSVRATLDNIELPILDLSAFQLDLLDLNEKPLSSAKPQPLSQPLPQPPTLPPSQPPSQPSQQPQSFAINKGLLPPNIPVNMKKAPIIIDRDSIKEETLKITKEYYTIIDSSLNISETDKVILINDISNTIYDILIANNDNLETGKIQAHKVAKEMIESYKQSHA